MKILKLFFLFLFVTSTYAQSFDIFFPATSFSPNALTVKESILYVSSGQTIAKRINDSWVAIDPEPFPDASNEAETFRMHVISEDKIYASSFRSGSDTEIKVWNGTEWLDVGTFPSDVNRITDIEYVSDTKIYVSAFAFSPSRALVYEFDGTNWTNLNLPIINSPDPKVTYASDTEIYASLRNSFYRYDGTSWTEMNTGFITSEKPVVEYLNENDIYHGGSEQLINFASNTPQEVGDLYTGPGELRGYIDHIIAFAENDIYASVVRESGSSSAKSFFVSHWNGTEWNRLWSFNSSNATDDDLTSFVSDGNYIYGKVRNRSVYRFDRTTLSVEDISLNEIAIYPNPVTTSFKINADFDAVEMFNNLGQKVQIRKISDSEFEAPKISGIYFLKVRKGSSFSFKKILKE